VKLKKYHLIGLGKISQGLILAVLLLMMSAGPARPAFADSTSPPVLNTMPGLSVGPSVGPGQIPNGLSAADWLSIQGQIAGGPYLKASNTGADDQFGYSMALSGDTLVVGAYLEDSNATGVGGEQGNNSASESGAAYVFVRSGGLWSQQAYLKASNTGMGDGFGLSVALSGDTLVVGANFEDSNATGVGGDQGDNSAVDAGAAYLFAPIYIWLPVVIK